MIDKTTQGASPVISRNTLSPGNVWSGVRSAAIDRLQFSVQNHNGIPNNIAMGLAAKPSAAANNEMAARVTGFDPKPGRHPRLGMHLQVQKAPGSQVDTVIDAIQRYLNISPRREPTSDPKDEASIARHPQQIIEAASRWDDALPYQFAMNGAKSYQLRPEIRRWGGSLSATLVEPGLTGVAAPATREAQPGPRDVPGGNQPDLVFAAQAAMRDMLEFEAEPAEPAVAVGQPNITGDPYFDPAFAAQNAMLKLREMLDRPRREEFVTVGAGGYSDRAYNDPATAYKNAINRSAENMAELDPDVLPIVTVGAGGYSDQAGAQPAVAYKASIERTRENLLDNGAAIMDEYEEEPTLVAQKTVAANMATMDGPQKREYIEVGEGNMLQSVHQQPDQAARSGVLAAGNLIAAPGANLDQARAGTLKEAYQRAMRIMRRDENFRLDSQVVGLSA